MRCPYCSSPNEEATALAQINLELIKMLQAFVGSNIMFRTMVHEPIDEKRAKDMEDHVSRATAAAAIHRLEQMVTARGELIRELTKYRLQFGPLRYEP